MSRLPLSLQVLLQNLIRFAARPVAVADVEAFVRWLETRLPDHEIAFPPARVLLQDFTGMPALVDLAAMRAAMAELDGHLHAHRLVGPTPTASKPR